MITQERLKELMDYDPLTGVFVRKTAPGRRVKVGDVAGCDDGYGYLCIWIDGKKYKSHRLAWLYVYGEFPPDSIDHINGVRYDNRIENLRAVTNQENTRNINKSANNTSGYLGVRWYKRDKKWAAQIKNKTGSVSKHIHLGYFNNIEDAIEARKQGELKYWGEASREYRENP